MPQHHWFHLGRLVTNIDGRATLMSWGGTMFEYLMPQLLLRAYPGTLLDQSCRAGVRRQIEYGKERRVPWGISESAYSFTDLAGNYQYKAFGVPGLGLKRGLADELVVSPYATALAGIIDPAAAAANLTRLTRAGLDGRFGFYESIDYQPRKSAVDAATMAGAGEAEIVRAFFAHHQGMSLVALTNVLHDDIFVTRFHADPRIKATELLLQERVPREAILAEARPAEGTSAVPSIGAAVGRRFRTPHTTSPHTHFLSNGRYTAALTHAGGGSSTWRGLSVTRRREDRTSDAGAHFIYLRDPWSGDIWSPTYQPICREPDVFETTFDLEKGTFRRRDGDFETLLQVVVSPEDDVEVRRLSITNRGDRPREIEVTSYAEIVLARPEDDVAHPAFGKLFIETEYDAQSAGLLFSRRPRSAEEANAWAFHVLAVDGRLGGAVEWETDRARFLGRGRSTANPIAIEGRALSGTTGAVLDPVAALRERVRLAPGAFVRVTFATGIATDRTTALALVRKYRDASAAARAFSMASTHAHITLQHLGLSDDQAMLCDRLASRVFGSDATGTSADDLARNVFGQSNLWGRGISGDLPIVLVHVGDASAIGLVRQLLHAQEYWRVKDLRADLVILNDHPADYLDEVQAQLTSLVREPRWSSWVNKPGGMFVLRSDGMPDADCHLLSAVARLVVRGDLGELAPQLNRKAPWLSPAQIVPGSSRLRPPKAASVPATPGPWVMENGIGGFTPDGREYVIVLDGDRETPLPWSNVLANRHRPQRVGSGFYVGRQQPGESVDTVRQRSAHRPHGRSDLHPRRERRQRLGLDARAAVASSRFGALGSAARGGLQPISDQYRWPRTGSDDRGRARRSGQGLAADADQHLERRPAAERVRLRRVGARSTALGRTPVRGLGAARGHRGDSGKKRLQHRVQGSRRLLARDRTVAIADLRSRRFHRPQPHAECTRGVVPRRARRARRRRPRSLRRAADHDRDPAGRITPRRFRARSGRHRRAGR